MTRNYTAIATKYANEVVSGVIPAGQLVKLACQRQLDDLKKQDTEKFPYVFNPVMLDSKGKEYQPADRICKFAEKLKHVKGPWKGEYFKPEPWQIFILATLFGWVHFETGLRRFRELYAEIPRKNGKSFIGAVIGLYMLLADDENVAEVFSGAGSQKQALHVFKPAWTMAKTNLELKDYYNITIYGNKPDQGSLVTESDYSKFEPLIGNPGDGDSPSCYLCDEFHEHPDDRQYMTMTGGMGSRLQPMTCIITTAGSNLAGPCYAKRAQVVKILEGHFENDSIFGLIYTIDKDDDWTDFNVWKKANPNYDISVFDHDLRALLLSAIQDASKQNLIRCKRLNQWMTAATAFFNMAELEKCADPDLKLEDFEGEDCWPGIDIASKVDLAAKVKVFKRCLGQIEVKGKLKDDIHYYAFADHYCPSEATKGEDKSHYKGWGIEGWLNVTPGARIDIEQIQEDLETDAKHFNIIDVPHDPWNAAQLAANMMEKNLEMVEVQQTAKNLSEPTKELDALILDHKFHYNGDPLLYWCIANVVCEYDTNDNVKPKREKGQDQNKIDGAIALIMGLGRAMHHIIKPKGNDGSLL